MGPAIATQIILKSSLLNNFNLVHFDTRINKEIATMGKWGIAKIFKSISIYFKFLKEIKKHQPAIILVPISQTTLGFLKMHPLFG